MSGAVTGMVRKSRADRIQQRSGVNKMILSPRAGGVGLTLMAANHVIPRLRWWIGKTPRHPRYGEHSVDLRLNRLMEHGGPWIAVSSSPRSCARAV